MNKHEYCKNCQDELGLHHLVTSEEYIQGVVDTVLHVFWDDAFSHPEYVVGIVLGALKGCANPAYVYKLIMERHATKLRSD